MKTPPRTNITASQNNTSKPSLRQHHRNHLTVASSQPPTRSEARSGEDRKAGKEGGTNGAEPGEEDSGAETQSQGTTAPDLHPGRPKFG